MILKKREKGESCITGNFTFSLEGLKSGRKKPILHCKNLKVGPSKVGLMGVILIYMFETRNWTVLGLLKTKREVNEELNLKLRL